MLCGVANGLGRYIRACLDDAHTIRRKVNRPAEPYLVDAACIHRGAESTEAISVTAHHKRLPLVRRGFEELAVFGAEEERMTDFDGFLRRRRRTTSDTRLGIGGNLDVM